MQRKELWLCANARNEVKVQDSLTHKSGNCANQIVRKDQKRVATESSKLADVLVLRGNCNQKNPLNHSKKGRKSLTLESLNTNRVVQRIVGNFPRQSVTIWQTNWRLCL